MPRIRSPALAQILECVVIKEQKPEGDRLVKKPIASNLFNTGSRRKEEIMKARNCCKTMEAELTAWKANVYDIVRKMEELPGGEKEKILPNIEDLHILISEMDQRIDQIRDNCTPETGIDDIRTDRELFDKSLSKLRVTAEEAMRGLGGGNFGG
jgi:hypothetical protein